MAFRSGAMRGLALLPAFLLAGATASVLPRQDETKTTTPWVTVDADGATATITTEPFPGDAALPTASADGSGAFPVCDLAEGATYQPFCAPQSESRVEVGKTYFVTWDVSWFETEDRLAQVYADFSSSDGFGGKEGFYSDSFPISQGYFAWTVDKDMLPERRVTDVQFYLAYPKTFQNETETISDRDPGPKVRVVQEEFPDASPANGIDSGSNKGLNVAAVVVSVVIGVLVLAGIGLFVWWFGKKKGWFGTTSQGYGVRKSRIQRSGVGQGNNIRLEERKWSDEQRSPTPGGANVFREEIRRQETGGR